MTRICRYILTLVVACLICGGVFSSVAMAAPVAVIQIKGQIDQGQVALVNRAMKDAADKGAQALVFEIDTFGGLVDSAVAIRDKINDSSIPTICYIKNRAWSAGALIAIANQHIAIVPGGSIGAAEPIPTTEKTVAALKAEFAATASNHGKNPKVAEAMVDKSLGYLPFAEPGQILALTDYQALQVGYADLVAANREMVLSHYGLPNEVIEYQLSSSEKFAAWLSEPAIKGILLSILFVAVLTEIKTAGLGIAAGIGIVAAALFFGSQWLTGGIGWLEILLFLGGILLIIIELHAPGMTIFGVGGIIAILASIFLTLGGDLPALNILAISLVVAVIIFSLLLKKLPSSKLWSKLVLQDSENTQAGFVSAQDFSSYLGREGITLTLLRPAGIVDMEGTELNVVSQGSYIPAGIRVKVVSITGNRIVVKPITKQIK